MAVDDHKREKGAEEFDIIELPSPHGPFPLDNTLTATTFVLTWVLFFLYLCLRAKWTWQITEPNLAAYLMVWLNTTMEFMAIIHGWIGVWEKFLYLAFGRKPPRRPRLYLQGDTAPSIDVCITCCGEDTDMIMDTVAAAATQDYPTDKLRVFLLDDGQSPSLQQAVQRFKQDGPNQSHEVTYLSRCKVPGVPHYFKSGNIRFGLEETARCGPAAEFFAALDADMIPDRDWLRRVVPHVLQNPQVAMAIPPQCFYNAPAGDLLGQDTNVFAQINEPMNDSMGSSLCTGSGYVLRRSALVDINGWPLAEAGEDILCSYLLVGHGWEVTFVCDQVQFGLVPPSLAAWFKQRARWTDGNILIFRKLGWFIPGLDPTPRRRMIQRAIGVSHVIKTYLALPNTITLLLLPWVFWPIHQATELNPQTLTEQSRLQVLFLAAVIMERFSWDRLYHGVGTRAASLQKANRFWNTPLNFARIVASWIPGRMINFAVTGTIVSTINERSARWRKPFWHRVLSPLVLVYVFWILYALVPLVVRARVCLTGGWGTKLVPVHPAAATALFGAVVKFWIPLQYMGNPPTVQDRHRDLLESGADGVYRVPAHRKKMSEPRNGVSWKDVVEVLIIVAGHRF